MTTPTPPRAPWATLDPDRAKALTDVRLQVHHAAQFLSALGISFLPPAPDDSHTSLAWDGVHGALTSRAAGGVTLALDVAELVLSVHGGGAAGAPIALHGKGITQAMGDVRDALDRAGLDASRYTLRRHFELPHHPVADGAPFDATDRAGLQELSRWFGNGALAIAAVAARRGGSPPACWPHHFDLASLVTVAPGRTTGAGLAPGDGDYDEPYFYVNVHPAPGADALVGHAIAGGGHWHTHEWVGAVLPGSAITGDGAGQAEQVRQFLDSALEATVAVLSR